MCVHTAFKQLEQDTVKLGVINPTRPVVELQVGNIVYYFVKLPNGKLVQIIHRERAGRFRFQAVNSLKIAESMQNMTGKSLSRTEHKLPILYSMAY